MPGRVLFKEDFFERVVDIAWESEPKVYWMAGTGAPLIINSMVTGGNRAAVLTSEDGINWEVQDIGNHSGVGQYGYGALYAGIWMRNSLEKGGDPTWVMVGSDGRGVSGSGAVYSHNGTGINGQTYFDDRHSASELGINTPPGLSGGGSVYAISGFNFPDWHQDRFTSSNGRTWSPANYHGGDGGEGFAARALAAAPPSSSFSPVARFTTPDPEGLRRSLLVPRPPPLLVPDTFADSPGVQKRANEIVYIPSRNTAQGRVKKGKHAGRTLTITIDPYHQYQGGLGDAAHGDATVKVVDTKSGKVLGKVNTGVNRTICIGYGHYVFVIGGSSGSGAAGGDSYTGKSTLAHSEDGMEWKVLEMGVHDQVNPIVVGPRK